jgi:ArsR family transcriptional regulator
MRDLQIRSANKAVEILGPLSHPTRLSIVCLLLEQERCVLDIVEALGTTKGNISQHLRVLERAEFLSQRKESNRVYYRVKDLRLESFMLCPKPVLSGIGESPRGCHPLLKGMLMNALKRVSPRNAALSLALGSLKKNHARIIHVLGMTAGVLTLAANVQLPSGWAACAGICAWTAILLAWCPFKPLRLGRMWDRFLN